MPGQDWQFVGSFEDNKHFRHTPSGLILTVIPVGSAESDEMVGEMKTLMADIRRDPQAVRKQYSADDLLEQIERYFRYCVDERGGYITDQVRRDADVVYDWPGAPTVLARVMGLTPGELRELLGRLRHLRCPGCQQTFTVVDKRRKGGFRIEAYYCQPYNEDLIEYQPKTVYDWRKTSGDSG